MKKSLKLDRKPLHTVKQNKENRGFLRSEPMLNAFKLFFQFVLVLRTANRNGILRW